MPKGLDPLIDSSYTPSTGAYRHALNWDAKTHRPRAVSSAVEHYVDIVGVTGSNPVPPTINTCEGAI